LNGEDKKENTNDPVLKGIGDPLASNSKKNHVKSRGKYFTKRGEKKPQTATPTTPWFRRREAIGGFKGGVNRCRNNLLSAAEEKEGDNIIKISEI